MKDPKRVAAAKKAWVTIRANQEAEKWSEAGRKAWRTRRAKAKKLSDAGKKAWATRRANGNA
jgi:hypothetical protein